MKSILHIAAPARNFGDAALCWGLHKRLRDEAIEELRFTMVDIQATRFTDAQIGLINASFDAILVGGGGLVMDRSDVGNETRSGWQWDITRELLWQIKVPLVVYAIGFNQLPYATSPVTKEALQHLEDVATKASAFSFRDEQSAWTCKMAGADVVPDPALWVEPHGMWHCWSNPTKTLVGVNWAGDRVGQRWPDVTTAGQVHDRLMEALKAANISAHLIPHHPDDMTIGDGSDIVPSYFNVPLLAGVYEATDVAIGTRGHANIIAAAVGTPPISVGHQAKNRWFMESIGLVDNHIPDDATPTRIENIINDAIARRVTKPSPNHDFDRRVIECLS